MALYEYIDDSGTIVPDTSQVLADVQTEFLTAFGSDLVIDPGTPQGALIALFAAERIALITNNAELANQINPNIAGGVFLDAIWALLGGQRAPSTYSQVLATVTGIAGTIIPTSVVALTTSGDSFSPVSIITIGSGGTATGIFQATTLGPIAVPVATLTQIQTGVFGWETVTNTVPGTVGTAAQSDAAVRALRQNTLALQGTALPLAIQSALYGLNIGVTSLTFQENVTASTVTINGVSMLPHSIYVCVTNSAPLVLLQVVCVVTGAPGTVIPAGSEVSDGTNVYKSLAPIEIDQTGNGSGIFQALLSTAPAQAANTLTTIVTSVSGWSTVNNPLPNTAYSEAFLLQVAQVLLANKSAGANWSTGPGSAPYGPQTINVTDPYSGQIYPVSFDVPTPIPINILVDVTVPSTFVGDPVALVQAAIAAYAAGQVPGYVGFTIGATVSAFEIAGAVNAQVPGLVVTNCFIALSPTTPTVSTPITNFIYQQPTLTGGVITVVT